MGSRFLTDLAEVCRRTGFPVIEVGGGRSQTGEQWKSRARSSGGYDSGKPTHLMIHHTASGPSADGWPDVNYMCFASSARPMANLYLARNGTIYVMAAGATNTNGLGHDPCGVTADNNMNRDAIAIEAGNTGTGSETWPASQLDCYLKLCKEIEAAYGIPNSRCHAHWEWAPTRKIDPAGPPRPTRPGSQSWNMDAFRNDVVGISTQPPVQPPDQPPVPPTTTTGVYVVANAYRMDVRQGSTGKMAKMCQQQINLIAGQGIAEDGSFGPQSVGALKNVQTVLGVPADGWCGPQTWQAFENGIRVQASAGDWD